MISNLDLAAAALSSFAYEPARLTAINLAGFTWFKEFQKGANAGVVAGDSRSAWLAVAGTNDLTDLFKADLPYTKADFIDGRPELGRVHRGFLRAFRDIWPVAKGLLDELDPTLPRIYCGHSLGAAIVMQAAAVARPAKVRVFGCPRIGNANFARLLDGVDIIRFEAWVDPVTFVPPRTTVLQAIDAVCHWRRPTLYTHAGPSIRVPASGHSMDGYLGAMYRRLAE